MSIALNARVKELERRIATLESQVDVLRAEKVAEDAPVVVMADAEGIVDVGGGLQVEAAELLRAAPGSVIPVAKRKPGRPPKNG